MRLWDITVIDWLVILLVAFAFGALILVGASWIRARWAQAAGPRYLARYPRGERFFLKHAKEILSVFLVVLGILVAYATLRNQAKLEVETRISDQAYHVLSLEVGDTTGFVRCMYDWWGHSNFDECRRRITIDEPSFNLSMLYVEESLFIFHDAANLQRKYGSDYWCDIEYWADDIGEDVTGMFSYYVLNRYSEPIKAKSYLRNAGICIPDLCDGYLKIVKSLGSKAKPNSEVICDSQPIKMACEGDWRSKTEFRNCDAAVARARGGLKLFR